MAAALKNTTSYFFNKLELLTSFSVNKSKHVLLRLAAQIITFCLLSSSFKPVVIALTFPLVWLCTKMQTIHNQFCLKLTLLLLIFTWEVFCEDGQTNSSTRKKPQLVAIGFDDLDDYNIVYKCGGTMVTGAYILTSAACAESERLGHLHVRFYAVGQENAVYSVEDPIIRMVKHPNYDPISRQNDIALIERKYPVLIFKYIVAGRLPNNATNFAQEAIFPYWDGLFDRKSNEKIVYINANMNNSYCDDKFASNLTFSTDNNETDSHICVSVADPDTLKEDSGAPLLVSDPEDPNNYTIIGIKSRGNVFINVLKHVEWIKSVIKNLS